MSARVGAGEDDVAVQVGALGEAPSLPGLLDLAWVRLEAGAASARVPARNLALATATREGPRIRTLVLRAADRGAGTLDLHADLASRKIVELREDPRAMLHVWDEAASLQIQARARAEILAGEAVEAIWARVPEAARSHYGGAPDPGRPIPSPDAYEPSTLRERFTVLRFHVEAIETLLLSQTVLRAAFRREGGFMGEWLAP